MAFTCTDKDMKRVVRIMRRDGAKVVREKSGTYTADGTILGGFVEFEAVPNGRGLYVITAPASSMRWFTDPRSMYYIGRYGSV
tara:strand:- start:16 stop:264 length:249 start_codon:yes stop_codon:yes gene_type:complete